MKEEPLILAIETAQTNGSLAVLKGERLIDFYIGSRNTLRSEDLLIEINKLLKKNGYCLEDINLIAVSTGPGSFTGIRIGMATAQALSFAVNCPITGASILQILALKEGVKNETISVIPAGRDRLFWQFFNTETSLVKEGNFQEFVDEINFIKNKDTALIASKELENLFRSNSKDFPKDFRIIFASDNAAELLALFSYHLYKNTGFSNNKIIPEYTKNVVIGKHR